MCYMRSGARMPETMDVDAVVRELAQKAMGSTSNAEVGHSVARMSSPEASPSADGADARTHDSAGSDGNGFGDLVGSEDGKGVGELVLVC